MSIPRGTLVVGVLALAGVTGCGSAPRFEALATNSTGKHGASSLSIPVPASTQGSAAGDLLVAVLGVKVNPSTSGPSGWTAVLGMAGFNGATCGSDQEGIACQLAVYYKLAQGSESTATFSWGTTYQAAGAVLRYNRVHQSTPIGATSEQSGSSSMPTAPSVTTVASESRVLRLAVSEADDALNSLGGSLILTSEPTTPRFTIVSFPPASVSVALGCGPPLSGCGFTSDAVGVAASDRRRASPGAAGSQSWSLPGSDQWVGATIELRSPAGGGPVVQ